MPYASTNHSFAICAYKESPYLEDCIASLEMQSEPASIILCTATPNEHITSMARKYDLPLYINTGAHGIAEDWNFAYSKADTPLVTLAHQDDVYDPNYLHAMLDKLNKFNKPLICFSDYYEIRNGEKVFSDKSRNLRIKETALLPLRAKAMQRSRWMRRRVLSICDPICCPAVTYVKKNLPEVLFESHLRASLDWQAWEKLSLLNGSFCYVHQPLMGHRIHEESTTTEVIGNDNGRSAEDLEMYMKFWPRPIAAFLNRLYSGAQKSNKV